MTLQIEGIGVAIPARSIEQPDAAEVARNFVHESEGNLDVLPMLYRMTLVKRRGSVLLEPPNGKPYQQSFYPAARSPEDRGPSTAARMDCYAAEAPPLAIESSRRALEDAGASPSEITHLVTVSCTGFTAPGVEFELIRKLGLSPSVARTNVGFMGCHGALNGLRVADGLALTSPSARVLLCSVELCSLHYSYGWDTGRVVANALFADGSAAIVGSTAVEQHEPWRLVSCDSLVLPETGDEMTWRIGDHGFEMTLEAVVPEIITDNLEPWLAGWLDCHNLSIDDIGSWAIHPGGPRIVAAAARSLGLPKTASAPALQVLSEHGNMSSATLLFVLEQLRRNNAPLPCVAIGFGPGLVAEAALFM